jgi:hypothetical protein
MTMKQTKEQFVGITYEELLAENAMLWEELAVSPQCETCEAMLDCDECLRADDSVKERKGLDFENAKLRELVRDLYQCSRQVGCDHCGYEDGCAMFDRMAQLGVEVNDA